MSLPDFSPQMRLFDVQNLLGDAFADDDRFRLFAQTIYPRLVAARPDLAQCYCATNGRPGIEPVLLLGISVLQFMERVPDRQAMELVRYHVGWKLALRLPLDVAAPDPSGLTYFRQRLLQHTQGKVAFDAVLAGLVESGLVPRRSRQRLDSTHVLGAVARMSSLECVREALRLALKELAAVDGLDRPEFWGRLWERYVESKLEYRLEEEALAGKYLEAGADLLALAAWVEKQDQTVRGGKHAQTLQRVLAEQFEVVEGKVGKRAERPSGSVQNPNEPEAQWSSKDKGDRRGWVGYKAQVAETVEEGPCEKGEPTRSFLTAVETQVATGSEPAGMKQALAGEEASGLELPPELLVDSGYVSAEAMKDAAAAGRELTGPALGCTGRGQGLGTEAFDVEVEQRRAVCPAGQANTGCSRLEEKATGKVSYRFEWRGPCATCPMKEQCLGPGKEHRTLEVGEHHTYLQSRRREQKTEAFAKRMHQRNGIEGTISELTRGHGMRRSRYRGLNKTRLCNWLIGAACNAKRWIRRRAWELGAAARAAARAARELTSPAAAGAAAGS